MTELNNKLPPWPTILKGAFFGALIGVFAASNGLCAVISFSERNIRVSELLSAWLFVTMFMGLFAGPGALVLGAILTVLLRPFGPRMRSRRRFLFMGMAAGVPLGIFNLLAVSLVLGENLIGSSNMEWILIVPAISGGAGLGLGCALAIPFKKRVEAPPEPEDSFS